MTPSAPPLSPEQAQARDAFVERLLGAARGTFDIFTIYLGERLGYYRALVEHGALTPGELARHTGTHERPTREWLEQQTVNGIIQVSDHAAEAAARRYSLPVPYHEVLTDADSLNYLAPLSLLIAGSVRPLPAVLDAFRNGNGVPFHEYGPDLRDGQAGINRPAFLHQLAQEWLPAMPDVHARLLADPPAKVADIGCGYGWSSIGIARHYPKVQVDGFDLDAPSVQAAQAIARAEGLADRVHFAVRDAGDPALRGQYDLVAAFECVHDMSNPVSALRAMHSLAGENGVVLVVDERVGDEFTPQGNDVEWMMYGWSVLHCLHVGMVDPPAVGTGTVMRTGTLTAYAREAGFRDVEVLPIDNFFFRFYRLRQ
jgi:SAM-dependent methyltransferase